MEHRSPSWCSSILRKTWGFFVLSLPFSALWCPVESSTHEDDVLGLFAIQQAWGQRAVSVLQWTGNDPCSSAWRGIKCNSSNPQRVTSIVLSGLGLVGELASDIGLLSGLITVDMSYNNLTGSIPSNIGQLTQLNELSLQFNNFTGKIPPQIGQLKSLSILSLNGNNLIGKIPNEIGLLENLYWLDLAQNELEGAIPYSSDGNSVQAGLDNLTKAAHFHLNNNSLSGTIPKSICHSGMTLIHLLLDSNRLKGTIPGELGSCNYLLILKLDNNLLQGAIPNEIGRLVDLTELRLSDNMLGGPLPDLSNLINLVVLDLSNNSLDVHFPSWMQSLASLTDLIMQNSSVRGQIPPPFFQLQVLSEVKLGNNKINGTLDISMATGQLSLVSMENNEIQEVIRGTYSEDLQLQGNPVCTNSSLPEKVCVDSSSVQAPPTSYGTTTTCSNSCPSGYSVNPVQCTCTIPYEGTLIYRAPAFNSLSNTSRIRSLVSVLAKNLSVDQKQVEVVSPYFNDQNQLIVPIEIFPSGSATRWTWDDVLRMSRALDSGGVSLPGFGPPMFQQYPYGYDDVSTKGSGLSLKAKIGIAVGAASLLLVILAMSFLACLQKRRADKAVELSKPFGRWGLSGKDSTAAPQLKSVRFFPYAELKKATNNFSESNKIGCGGFGKVYRGILSSGEQVAIKRAERTSMQGATEFKNEIELLSRVHHKNIVGLLGFCVEQGVQMLVYEYMAGGSLRDCLWGHSGVRLDWRQRIMIALGSARGIAYLHELVHPPIIHRDIKSTNILLDDKKIAKVADFGLSRIGPGEGSAKQHVSTQVKGTVGYLDPEYYTSQKLTEKSDVYSYGVLMLELITARAPIEHGKYVVNEVKMAIDKGGLGALRSMLDQRLKDEELPELNAFVRIVLSCVDEAASRRPSMGEVVKQLEEMVGNDYHPESGSLSIDLQDLEFMHTSGNSSDLSFLNSSSHISPSFQSG